MITLDGAPLRRGTEMARHLTISRSLCAPIYFCDSRSLAAGQQREHEGLLRDYFPNGTDLRSCENLVGAGEGSRTLMTSLEGVPQRCRRGADLAIWVSMSTRGCLSLAMVNGTPMAR